MIVMKGSGEQVTVRIEVLGEDAFAYEGTTRIGWICTSGEDDLGHGCVVSPSITSMHVYEEYRRNGIATALIRTLVEQFGKLHPAQRNIGIGNINALTDDGEALTIYAQKQGLIFPFPEDQPAYDD